MAKLEFFFDCSSPWSYLAFTGIQPIVANSRPELHWRPILVGGVFNAVNQEVYSNRENPNPRRHQYMRKDLQDWFRYYKLNLNWPAVFPVNSAKAMRGALLAMEEDCLVPYASAMFVAYWSEGQDISQDDVLYEIANRVGIDVDTFRTAITHPDYKQALRNNTQELIDRGGFGSPTIFLNDDDMYFGNDRLILIQHALNQNI